MLNFRLHRVSPPQSRARGSVGVENAAGERLASPQRCLEGVVTLVLRVYGCPMAIQTLPVSLTSVTRVTSAFPAITSVSNITSAIIAQYAGDVEAEISARISDRYALPLATECPILTAIATRETIYRIAVQRALVQFPSAQQGQHPMQTQHLDDQKLLEAIVSGKIPLLTSSGAHIAVDTAQAPIFSTTKGYLPTFHEGAWPDMVQDTEKLDDITTDRLGRGL